MTASELSRLPKDEFVAALGAVFEASPWVAEKVWQSRPFQGAAELHAAMVRQVESASRDVQLGLLRAHPNLGARARMSAASVGEQNAAGLDRLTPEEHEKLVGLNRRYRERFGFPFLFAVKGSTSRDVVHALEARIDASPEDEFREALRQVYRIAAFRLEAMGLTADDAG